MRLVPLSNLLKYSFRQEGLATKEHKALLDRLAKHNDKPYCESLKERGMLSDCKKTKDTFKLPKQHKTAGQPVSADKGQNVMCGKHGVLTQICQAGKKATCNGHYMYGFCEKFNIRHAKGYW